MESVLLFFWGGEIVFTILLYPLNEDQNSPEKIALLFCKKLFYCLFAHPFFRDDTFTSFFWSVIIANSRKNFITEFFSGKAYWRLHSSVYIILK